MFENVTYTFYSSTLGRSVIPDESTFDSYKAANIQFVKKILPFIIENEENGIDSATCLMCEVDYETDCLLKNEGSVSSETVSGHSVSYDNTARNKALDLNSKSAETRKLEKIREYNYLDIGIF